MSRRSRISSKRNRKNRLDTKAEFIGAIIVISFFIFCIFNFLIMSIINDKDIPVSVLFVIILGGLIWLLITIVVDYKNKY
jgi:hypothetical protein